jgi:hypothetical protein
VSSLRAERYAYNDPVQDPTLYEMLQWFRFHGINPDYVCRPGYVERDPEEYAIRVWSYIPDEETHFKLTTAGSPVMYLAEYTNEGPPLPFPDVVYETWGNR